MMTTGISLATRIRGGLAVAVCGVWLAHGAACGATVCAGCGTSHDVSERTDFPFVTTHVDGKMHGDRIYDSTDSGNEIDWLRLHLHGDFGLRLNSWLRLETRIKIEEAHSHGGCGSEDDHGQVHHEDGDDHEEDDDHGDDHADEHHHHAGHQHGYDGENRYFQDHVAVIEELKTVFSLGPGELFAGKFNPRTGLDMHAFPGQYGYNVPEEYSILERIGVGGRLFLPTDILGTLALELSTFFADTTFLNEGVGEDRQVPHARSDGGLANTESFESFAASLSGAGWYTAVGDTIHALDWTVGAAWQDGGENSEHGGCADEARWSLGAIYEIVWKSDLSTRLVGEYMQADNFAGSAGDDAGFMTFGAGVYYRGWQVGGTCTAIDHEAGMEDGGFMQVTVGYAWDNGVGLHVGWREDNREEERNRSIGFTLSYHLNR